MASSSSRSHIYGEFFYGKLFQFLCDSEMKIPCTKIHYCNGITTLKVKKLCINGYFLQRNHGFEGRFHTSIVVTLQTCFNTPSTHAREGNCRTWQPSFLEVIEAKTMKLDSPSPSTITASLLPNPSFNASLLPCGSL